MFLRVSPMAPRCHESATSIFRLKTAMELKLDENLGKGPRDIFMSAGHDVRTVAGQRMEGASITN